MTVIIYSFKSLTIILGLSHKNSTDTNKYKQKVKLRAED